MNWWRWRSIGRRPRPYSWTGGNAFRAKGDFDQALVDYDQAIAFNPKNSGAHVDRALVWEKKGRHDQALQDYAEAIRLDPKMSQANVNHSIAFRETGEYGNSIQYKS